MMRDTLRCCGLSPANLGEYVAKGARIVTCLANGLDAEAYRTGCVEAITRVAKQWVAAELAQWGVATFAVSKVPDHEVGQACAQPFFRKP
jgi:hypothetical protein